MANTVPCTRNDPCASCAAEMFRPVITSPSTPLGIRQRIGMSYGALGLIQVLPPA